MSVQGSIRPCGEADFGAILSIVNEAAGAYERVIPPECWHVPYMAAEELRAEIAAGVRFWGYEVDGALVGVMGIQHVADVALVRHAYVRPAWQRQGIGGALLTHLRGLADRPLLVGTWAAARWAVRFYQKHGFALVSAAEKDVLLRRYWTVPPRQIQTSVVLADEAWFAARARGAERRRNGCAARPSRPLPGTGRAQ